MARGEFLIMLENGPAKEDNSDFLLSALKYEGNAILICSHLREESSLYAFFLPLIL